MIPNQAHLSPHVDTVGEQGWEERTDAALVHLLRHVLAKNSRLDPPLASLGKLSSLVHLLRRALSSIIKSSTLN